LAIAIQPVGAFSSYEDGLPVDQPLRGHAEPLQAFWRFTLLEGRLKVRACLTPGTATQCVATL
jgi:hypothetical protein